MGSGGWMDAGDYQKFTLTVSYTTVLMLASIQDYPASEGVLKDEARFGLDWLVKMWDSENQILYLQVTIGNGNADFKGDHNLLRLPEEDDGLDVEAQPELFYIKYRPLFLAGDSGSPISPNLAGKMAAAFGLGAQIW